MTRTIVKHSYIPNRGPAMGEAREHVKYLQFRRGKDPEAHLHRRYFDARSDSLGYRDVYAAMEAQRNPRVLIHKFVLSPGVDGVDLKSFARELMADLSSKTGRDLIWFAVEHDNTAYRHAHIVVMGQDRKGRATRFDISSYQQMRTRGDEIMEADGTLSRWREAQKDRLGQKLVRITRAAVYALLEEFNLRQSSQQIDRRRKLLEEEARALGEPPNQTAIRLRRIDREQRWQERQDKQWEKYTAPIKIRYFHPEHPAAQDPDEGCAVYSWRTSLPALRELEREYLDGDRFVRASMKAADLEKLQSWIKHADKQDKQLQKEAANIRAIELDYAEASTRRFDQHSSLEELKELQQLNALGVIYLQDYELLAIDSWKRAATVKTEVSTPENSYIDNVVGGSLRNKDEARELFLRARKHGRDWGSGKLTQKEEEELRAQGKQKKSKYRINEHKGKRNLQRRKRDRNKDEDLGAE